MKVPTDAALRSALSFSVVTGKDIELKEILSSSSIAGLSEEKIELINILTQGTEAIVEGLEEHSTHLLFKPQHFWNQKLIETSIDDSITLFLDGLLLPILFSGKRTTIFVDGLLYSPEAPSTIFFQESILRLLKPYIQRVSLQIEKNVLECIIISGKISKNPFLHLLLWRMLPILSFVR